MYFRNAVGASGEYRKKFGKSSDKFKENPRPVSTPINLFTHLKGFLPRS